MTIISVKNYTITTIYNIITGERLISEGLQVCKKCDNSPTAPCYAIVTIQYDQKSGSTSLDFTDNSILNIEDEEFPLFKRLVKIAEEMVSVSNKDYKYE